MKHLLPPGWNRPSGYSNGVVADGTAVYVAGMVGWNDSGEFAEGFVAQFALALKNTVAVLTEAGATPADIVRMTWYIKNLDLYRDNLPAVGRAYREIIGKNFPAMAVVGVSDLVARQALLEIETTAVIPEGASPK